MNQPLASQGALDAPPFPNDARRVSLVPFLDACKRAGISKAYAYALMAEGRWPRPVKVGRSSLIVESELDAWIDARIRERDAGVPA